MSDNKHPHVSEANEGNPVCEWVVAIIVVIAAIVAFLGYTMAATVMIAVTAIITGIIRVVLRDRSPWKVRSVGFDAFIGIGLGIGLIITYFNIFSFL